ncbi:predicted protein [Streptomyces viridochromogenes DSM 40736]|uniref:Predicted protein n=1 Tax=Streptomyces viridochromogenes (strain DSM 40736 / JCM 4977 / BCRC 1201 / Tue 494) TaxID=591159 RepID=D9X4M4_STRVT|nr:hypothetical protein [Streptomyces viridochromogenes]EFL29683.1 predicted protein [Streptomyces viridochromogenes DSM 40736]
MVGLVACLLLLPLVVPGPEHGGRAAQTAVTAAVDRDVVETPTASSAASAGGDAAGEPCPCGKEPSVRRPVARTPRAATAAGASVVETATPGVDRGGTDIGAARTSGRTGAVASVPNAVELQTFRC